MSFPKIEGWMRAQLFYSALSTGVRRRFGGFVHTKNSIGEVSTLTLRPVTMLQVSA